MGIRRDREDERRAGELNLKRSKTKRWKSVLVDLVARWRYRRVWRKRLRELDERGLLQSGRVVSSTPTVGIDEGRGDSEPQMAKVIGKVFIRALQSPGHFLIAGPVAIEPAHQLPEERVVPVTGATLVGEKLTLYIDLAPSLQEEHDTVGMSHGQVLSSINWNAEPPGPAGGTD